MCSVLASMARTASRAEWAAAEMEVLRAQIEAIESTLTAATAENAKRLCDDAKSMPVSRVVILHEDDYRDPITYEPYGTERVAYVLDACNTNPVLCSTLDLLYGPQAARSKGKTPFTNRLLESVIKANIQSSSDSELQRRATLAVISAQPQLHPAPQQQEMA